MQKKKLTAANMAETEERVIIFKKSIRTFGFSLVIPLRKAKFILY